MGEARNRGSFSQRKAAAIAKKDMRDESDRLERVRIEERAKEAGKKFMRDKLGMDIE